MHDLPGSREVNERNTRAMCLHPDGHSSQRVVADCALSRPHQHIAPVHVSVLILHSLLCHCQGEGNLCRCCELGLTTALPALLTMSTGAGLRPFVSVVLYGLEWRALDRVGHVPSTHAVMVRRHLKCNLSYMHTVQKTQVPCIPVPAHCMLV